MPSSPYIHRFYEAVLTKNITTTKANFFHTDYLKKYWLRRVCETLFITALIFGSQQHLLIDGIFGPISPVTGIALSALFLRGRTMLLGIFLGNLISYIVSQIDLPIAILYSFIFTCYIFLTREACLRWIGPVVPLTKAKSLFQFFIISAIFSGLYVLLISSLLIVPLSLYSSWLGEINGMLYLTPLCLLFEPFAHERYFTKQAWRWGAVTIGLMACQAAIFLVPESAEFALSLIIFGLVCVFGYCFPPIPMGVTLLGLSVLYLGTSLMQSAYDSKEIITVLMFQALFGLSISIYRYSKRTKIPSLLD